MRPADEDEERAALGLLTVLLRSLWHWSQEELAAASGVQRSQISLYELWKTAPSEPTLQRLAAAVWLPWGDALQVLPALRALVRSAARPASRRGAPAGDRDVAAAVGRAAADACRERVLPFLREHLPILTGYEPAGPEPPPERSFDRAALGLLVVLLRSLRHWTQEELACASGIQRTQISAYELWKRAPRRRTLERLAAAARVPPDAALAVLPFLRDLVRASRGQSVQIPLADRIGRMAETLFRVEMAGR
ncbi:MAG TPA: helix-turn-helix transcriptional regulator [Thermoanaerobaculia bacterium]|jgi:transcriptional regulator with XRE-family HTH domain|nr:helix-turn-helix transcriptional regulator [Thermoanaerobaculia bacterium]